MNTRLILTGAATLCALSAAFAQQTWEFTTTVPADPAGLEVDRMVNDARNQGKDDKTLRTLENIWTRYDQALKKGMNGTLTATFNSNADGLQYVLISKWSHDPGTFQSQGQFTDAGFLYWRPGSATANLKAYSMAAPEVSLPALAVLSGDAAAVSKLQQELNGTTPDGFLSEFTVTRDNEGNITAFDWKKGNQTQKISVFGEKDGEQWIVKTVLPNGNLAVTTTARPALQASNVTFPSIKPGDPVTIRGKQNHTVAWSNDMPTPAELDSQAERRSHFALYGSIIGGAVFIGLGTYLLRRR
jgi:hypothetical protein